MNKMIYICTKCGTIHLLDKDEYMYKVKHSYIVHICGRCGTAKLMGTDKEIDNSDNEVYYPFEMNISRDFKFNIKEGTVSGFISGLAYPNIFTVIYSKGYPVPMMSKGYFNTYTNGTWMDLSRPDLSELLNNTVPGKLKDRIDCYNKDCTTIDIERFKREVPEEDLYVIASSGIEPFASMSLNEKNPCSILADTLHPREKMADKFISEMEETIEDIQQILNKMKNLFPSKKE